MIALRDLGPDVLDWNMDSAQLRAARGLVAWSQSDLAQRAGVAERTVRQFEREMQRPHPKTIVAIQDVLETAGVVFIETDVGRGVILRSQGQ